MPTRKPLVAGQFYESDKKKLIEQIESCFEKGKGYPKPGKKNTIRAAIIPHAGYFFSGKAAAQVVKEIGETDVDTFVILGVNHSGIGGNTTVKSDFKTPLGTAKIDLELQAMIIKECRIESGRKAKEAHAGEHSIEVILPFLQYLVEDFTFVPIIVSEDMESLGKNLKKAVDRFEKKKKRKVCIIASADMTHFGACYRFIPFHEDIKERLYDLDRKAIDLVLKKNASGFLDYIKDTGATICGKNTIASLIYFLKSEKAKGKLLDYYTSADVRGDYHAAVGYAGIVFKEEKN